MCDLDRLGSAALPTLFAVSMQAGCATGVEDPGVFGEDAFSPGASSGDASPEDDGTLEIDTVLIVQELKS